MIFGSAKEVEWIKSHPLDIVLMLIVALNGLAVGLWAKGVILDDAMITFRVAENLARGRGFVYNVGDIVQVTTTPLYAMMLAVGVWLTGSAVRAALMLNIALSTFIPVLAYILGRRLSGWITGISAALLLTISPLLVIAFSMEGYLYVALILASMTAYAGGYIRLAGVLAGITALVRGDAVLLGACMLTYDFLACRRLRWRLIVPAITIPAGWYLFAIIYYGSPFPATLGAKVAQGQFNWLGQRFLDGLLNYWDKWTRVNNHDIFYLLPLLMIIGLLEAVRSEQIWLIIVGRDILYITAFILLAVPFAEWYYAPIMPGVALLTGRGVQFIADGAVKLLVYISKKPAIPRTAIAGTIAALLVVPLLSAIYPTTAAIINSHPDWKAKVYPVVARWIAKNTNTSANFATIDIGHLGYWSGRQIVDIVGLAQPDVAAHIADGDFGYAIRHYKPDMVLIGYSWLPEIQRSAWFQTSYIPRHSFKFEALSEPLMLFSRTEGVKIEDKNIPPVMVTPLDIDFNRQIKLTGYHLNRPLTPGGVAILTLFWQATTSIKPDYTVFVQLVDADKIIAQGDSKPQNGFYATPYWQPGESVTDSHIFSLPPDLPPGNYDILVGFYEAESGLRLPIVNNEGAVTADHVTLSATVTHHP